MSAPNAGSAQGVTRLTRDRSSSLQLLLPIVVNASKCKSGSIGKGRGYDRWREYNYKTEGASE